MEFNRQGRTYNELATKLLSLPMEERQAFLEGLSPEEGVNFLSGVANLQDTLEEAAGDPKRERFLLWRQFGRELRD